MVWAIKKHLAALSLCIALAIACVSRTSTARADWNGVTTGTADYLDPANWVGNNINDDIDNFALSGPLTLTFGANHLTNVGGEADWSPDATPAEHNLTLRSDGSGPYTITLQNNILVNEGNNDDFTVTIGSTTAGQELFLDLGGVSRTFTTGNRDRIDIVQPLVNAGDGFHFQAGLASTLHLRGDNAASVGGNVTTNQGNFALYHENALGTADVEITSNGVEHLTVA